jgi:cyclophilin family peptidyl-prolyl cis-trans isomerase
MSVPKAIDGYQRVPHLSETRVTEFDAARRVLEAGHDYRALVETDRGAMVVDLEQDKTPVTVNNFVFLALHRYYDGIVFHRVLDDFMAQTGDPTGTGRGGPGYRFADEFHPDLRHDEPGTLSMANAGPGTNGSQIFITFGPTPWLDGKHAVFGRIVDGVEVLDALTRIDPQRPSGAKPDAIREVTIWRRASA